MKPKIGDYVLVTGWDYFRKGILKKRTKSEVVITDDIGYSIKCDNIKSVTKIKEAIPNAKPTKYYRLKEYDETIDDYKRIEDAYDYIRKLFKDNAYDDFNEFVENFEVIEVWKFENCAIS